jgi:hypothetical protein
LHGQQEESKEKNSIGAKPRMMGEFWSMLEHFWSIMEPNIEEPSC